MEKKKLKNYEEEIANSVRNVDGIYCFQFRYLRLARRHHPLQKQGKKGEKKKI
jgi:hypothetical protein